MTQRGWTAGHLSLVGDDERLWTLEDASRLLGPPVLDAAFLRQLVLRLDLQPVGTRPVEGHDRRGRQPRVYRAIDLIKMYDALSMAA